MATKKPSFKKPRILAAYESPEELFSKLPNRAKSHGYLRGPQADALREYLARKDDADIALELPTGTGKTAVGLLIAEWRRRRSKKKVAYLTLTNQLAGQVLEEGRNLGLECADLRGSKDTRDATEVGRYQTAQAVGITTYSNLFNTNPVIQPSDLLVLDDAHGAEQFVSGMWTVRIGATDHPDLYTEAMAVLRPAMSDLQYRVLTDETQAGPVELLDTHGHPDVLSNLIALVDGFENVASIYFPWTLIRNKLAACLVLASSRSISIRPIIPPTHTHEPFIGSRQRIYMSATLGGEGDLRRSYGISNISTARAQHPQWGKRYIFAPGLVVHEQQITQLVAAVWKEMTVRRALLLVPSFAIGDRVFAQLGSTLDPKPVRLGAEDIEDSLDPFTEGVDTVLCLAGRYDGLDLPGDDCRLLIMAGSPAAVGPLERHQREHWKLGPLLRRRERTRLIQGMGRCTRDATDFAVILLLGQSLLDSITTPAVTQGLPGEIQRELQWGISQAEVAKKGIDGLSAMILGLLNEAEYRSEANENQEEIDLPEVVADSQAFDEAAKSEVLFGKTLWEGNYTKAYEVARAAADKATEEQLAGYRAWWFFLGAIAARAQGEDAQEIDCLRRARAIGINAGFLDGLLRKRGKGEKPGASASDADTQAERIWNNLDKWGWHGPTFAGVLKEMEKGLGSPSEATKFHIGLERLGQCLGAETMRPSGPGVPDGVWLFGGRNFTFEAKTESKTSAVPKKDVLQAKAHPDWLLAQRPELSKDAIQALLVANTTKLDAGAAPHAKGLNYVAPEALATLGSEVAIALKAIRAEFAGKEFAAVRKDFKAKLEQCDMHLGFVYGFLGAPLTK